MQFLISHWHCILPAARIIAAAFLLRDKPKKNRPDDNKTPERSEHP